jgi:predicted dehydrogenase
MPQARAEVGIAMLGYGLMGRAHSLGYRDAAVVEPGLQVRPSLRVICGRTADSVAAAADRYGFADWTTNWAEAVARPDVDIVDICTPPGHHRQAIEAAAAAGKAVICEKPLAATREDAFAAARAVSEAGVLAAVGFNYRRLPAVTLMKELIDDGVIGVPRAVRSIWLTDEFADPSIPFDWRFDRATGGTVTGDLGVHLIDLVHWLAGPVTAVTAQNATFVSERPNAAGPGTIPVRTDDSASALGRLANGAVAVFEMTRVAVGHPCDWTIEITGSEGSIAFDYRNLNEIWLAAGDNSRTAGFSRIRAEKPAHPYSSRWWPQGQGIGYQESFTNQVADLLLAWPEGPWTPDARDGAAAQAVVEAIDESCDLQRWVDVEKLA